MDSKLKKFDQLVGSFSQTLLPKLFGLNTFEIQFIEKAYNFAKEKHKGQLRKNGELYFIHPLQVASNLLQHQPDQDTIAAALLHDVVEDCEISSKKLAEIFNSDVAYLVEGVTKISTIEMKNKALELEFTKNHFSSQVDSYRKLLAAIAGDPRVLIIKLYDRLHNSQTLEWLPESRRNFYAKETIEIYAILAERIGMSNIKSQLEDFCFPYAYPQEYIKFNKIINQQQKKSFNFVSKKLAEIKKKIDKKNIIDCYGRTKHNFSIYKKLEEFDFDFGKIFDIVALRIISPSIESCYEVLGQIHNIYLPLDNLHHDYIAKPKDNGYRSLHATMRDKSGQIFEIQIRTPEMHQVAEYGIAAHWQYKELRYGRSNYKDSYSWTSELPADKEKIKEPQDKFFADKIFVFSPKGKIVELSKNATPLDFAFYIHTAIGLSCCGAKVNGKIVPISSRLKTGDVIEIIKNDKTKPSRDWFRFAKTNFARSKIREYFSDLEKPKHYQTGLNTINTELIKLNKEIITEKNSKRFSSKVSDSKLPFSDLYTALVAVGKKDLSKNKIIKLLYPDVIFSEKKTVHKAKDKKTIRFEIGDGFAYKVASCCKPKENNLIFGYITLQKTITVHKINCRERRKFDKERIIEAYWR